MPPVYFATGTSRSRAPAVSGERLINGFVEKQPPEAKGQAPIFGTPGLDLLSTLGSGPLRGAHLFQGVAYFVSGSQLWSLTSAYVATNLGGSIPGTGPVSMADNGTQIGIVNGGGMGGGGWIYTVAGGLVQISSPNFYPADIILFMDGYFIFNNSGTNEWFLSALYDGTTYNGLDFATAEAGSTNLWAVAQNLQLLFLFCADHIELWYDSGAADFPFDRYAGGIINYGCISPHTVIGQDGALFFLGADKTFYRLQANVPIRVSTHAIETLIAKDADITQAYCSTYTTQGHKFVVLTLPVSNQTLVFDVSTGKWHERISYNADGTSLHRWRGSCILEAFQTVLVGDAFTGMVGGIDWTTYAEYGNVMPMRAVSAPLHHDRKRIFLDKFELDIQAGVGLTLGQGSDPQCMLRKSKDGGVTWSAYQKWKSMGKIGERGKRLRWLRGGQSYQWTIEIEISDPVMRCIVAANADIGVGM